MSKPNFGVTFAPDAPVELYKPFLKMSKHENGSQTHYMLCSEIRETNFGFLQLVPSDGDPMTLYVRPDHILYMLKAELPSKFGFV